MSYYNDFSYCKRELINENNCILSNCDSVFDKICQKVCKSEINELEDCFEDHKDKIEKYIERRDEIDVDNIIMEILKKYEDEPISVLEPCSPEVDPCKDTAYPYCHVVNGLAVCSILESCPLGSEMGLDGRCSGGELGLEGSTCLSSEDCSYGLSCYQNICWSAAPSADYKYIRINDLSAKCSDNCDPEAGADIDAIVLSKFDKTYHYAFKVVGYMRADGTLESSDNNSATNPQKALSKPDGFKNYPISDGCYFYNSDVAGDDETNRSYTFVSLGGEGGYLIVEMDASIEAGDKIDVLELGECTMFNTESAPNKSSGKTASSEMISIEISADGNSWKLLGSAKADSTNKGIISFTVKGI